MRQSKNSYAPTASHLFTLEASKPQEQQIKIVEAAIYSFAVNGIEKTSYTSLAKTCGISRPLVHHYFPTLDSLFLLAAKYARQTLLTCALDGMRDFSDDEVKQLELYITGCFRWIKLFPHQAKFWMLYYYQCSHDRKTKDENSLMVNAGHSRIQKLIESGKAKKIFKVKNSQQTAKTIQILITGAIVSVITEEGFLDLETASELIFEQSLGLLKI